MDAPDGEVRDGVDLERVESANQIYVQMAKFCMWLHTLNIM